MKSYRIEFLDRLNGGTVLHIDFVDARSVAEAEAHAKIGFVVAQKQFGAHYYQVLEPGSKRVVASGPGGRP